MCQAWRSSDDLRMHVDGAAWRLPPKEAELRRRLWAQLYIIDRSISLSLGRPLAIQEEQCTVRQPGNYHDAELSNVAIINRPLSSPTKSTFLILHFKLAQVIGHIQLTCFGLMPRQYADVLEAERRLQEWKMSLPPHFRLDNPDTSLDGGDCSWLRPQRHTLSSKFHLCRISLHRPYLLRSYGRHGADYKVSAEACLTSSIADITLRLSSNETDPLDRFKWMTVASGFFSATILGILCGTRHRDKRLNYHELLRLLCGYIAVEKTTSRKDESLEAELSVLDMMVERAQGILQEETERRRKRLLSTPTLITESISTPTTSAMGMSEGTIAFSPIPSVPPPQSQSQSQSFSPYFPYLQPQDQEPLYTDSGEEWNEYTHGWAMAPTWDTTAPALPDPSDGKGWQEVMDLVMNSIGSSPPEGFVAVV
ncbi:hypothetical protein P7C73_g5486, partial [Tremellales sp. Uapishka_1]